MSFKRKLRQGHALVGQGLAALDKERETVRGSSWLKNIANDSPPLPPITSTPVASVPVMGDWVDGGEDDVRGRQANFWKARPCLFWRRSLQEYRRDH